MEPVQLKLYGLFKHTKASYLKQQLVSVLLALSLLPVWLLAPSFERLGHTGSATKNRFGDLVPPHEVEVQRSPTGGLSPEVVRMIGLIHRIPWIVAALLLAIAVETGVVLWLFAKKAAAQPATVQPEAAESS
ncbi:MAG: hypothetical protein JNM56_26510 [Planctomycetia bacterium]|nr:hypothetical protein [Planctomycetia bacterium]